jgi:probable HAF family extracellular repeat protein
MNSKTQTRIITLTLFATLALPLQLAAQAPAQPQHQYHHYQLIDPGTFGGPSNGLSNVGISRAGFLNNSGTLVGWANTSGSDSPYCGFGNCYAGDAFQLKNGVTTDLGRVPGGFDSQANWISGNGLIAGLGDNGVPDPLAGFLIPQLHGLLWENGIMTDLGSLPEGGYLVFPNAVNNRGEVVGLAQNTVPDANAMLTGYGYQTRAFYWKNGAMQDLGTLGTGTDAVAALINERGQVVGMSYTNSAPSAICAGLNGFNLTTASFIWDQKNGMRDIGGLGGTCTLASDFNNRGQVIGGSSLTSDSTIHAFVWNATTGVIDLLDPSDNSYGFAEGENDHGDVAGGTCDAVTCYAVLWRKRGGQWQKTNLSTITQSAFSISINSSEQVIGNWSGGAFLSEDGGPIVDLNTLIPANSGIQLGEAVQINDRGEIAAQGPDASGNNHAVVLIPCDENHPGVADCDYSLVDASAASVSPAPPTQRPAARTPPLRMPAGMLNRFRSRWGQRIPVSGNVPAPAAEQSSPVNTDGVDLEGAHLLGPLSGHHVGYCGVYGGKVTSYCIAYSYYSCLAKLSTACPSGQLPKNPGYFQCDNDYRRYVDLGRSCGF